MSFRNESFQNDFIPTIAPDRNFRSGTKSGRTFHKYHVKEVRANSETDLGMWIGQTDQLTQTVKFHFKALGLYNSIRVLSGFINGRGRGLISGWAYKRNKRKCFGTTR